MIRCELNAIIAVYLTTGAATHVVRDDSDVIRVGDRWAAVVATVGALAYVATKVHLALKGELGIAGFNVKPEVSAAFDNPGAAQWGNAALGMVLVALCLALVQPVTSKPLRLTVHTASWLGVAMIASGLVGLTLRAAGITSSREWEPIGLTAYATLAIGWVWVFAWVVAIHRHRRTSSLFDRREPTTT